MHLVLEVERLLAASFQFALLWSLIIIINCCAILEAFQAWQRHFCFKNCLDYRHLHQLLPPGALATAFYIRYLIGQVV